MHLAHRMASQTAVFMVAQWLLSQRGEAWPLALLVGGRPRLLGSQSTASGVNCLACPSHRVSCT